MPSFESNVLDEIAKYFVCLADEPSHWYCLNGSSDDTNEGIAEFISTFARSVSV
jgi:hypothetical protein